jgi:hypothetical protein
MSIIWDHSLSNDSFRFYNDDSDTITMETEIDVPEERIEEVRQLCASSLPEWSFVHEDTDDQGSQEEPLLIARIVLQRNVFGLSDEHIQAIQATTLATIEAQSGWIDEPTTLLTPVYVTPMIEHDGAYVGNVQYHCDAIDDFFVR